MEEKTTEAQCRWCAKLFETTLPSIELVGRRVYCSEFCYEAHERAMRRIERKILYGFTA